MDPHRTVVGQSRQAPALANTAAPQGGQGADQQAVARCLDGDYLVPVFGLRLFLVPERSDLEKQIAPLDRLAVLDEDRRELPLDRGADLDIALRVDPALIGLLDGCGLRLDDGDRDLPGVLLRLPPVRMALGQVESD